MQQSKSYWRLVAVASIVSAFVASACVVTTDPDDDGTAGAAGSGTAGAGTAGAGTAGAGTAGAGTAGAGTAGAGTAGAGTAGTGGSGAVPFQCDPGEGGAQGTPNSCAPADPNDDCQKCVQAKCCTEYELCYATDPGNQCGWGGPLEYPAGTPNDGGEALCMQLCLQAVATKNEAAPDDTEVGTCANECATTLPGSAKECQVIGVQTSDLVACLRKDCSAVCIGP